ncbi:TPA: hypothetical protein ACH3X1_001556 [Trebouxia sp. C0004]
MPFNSKVSCCSIEFPSCSICIHCKLKALDINVVQYDQNMSSLQLLCALHTCMAQLPPCAAWYHRHLAEDETEMRGRGAKLNLVSIPREGEGTRADDLALLTKTDQAMRQYGRDSDAALASSASSLHIPQGKMGCTVVMPSASVPVGLKRKAATLTPCIPAQTKSKA